MTERALCVYIQHFTEEYKPALTLINTVLKYHVLLQVLCTHCTLALTLINTVLKYHINQIQALAEGNVSS